MTLFTPSSCIRSLLRRGPSASSVRVRAAASATTSGAIWRRWARSHHSRRVSRTPATNERVVRSRHGMDGRPHHGGLYDLAGLERGGQVGAGKAVEPRPEADVAGRRVLRLQTADPLDRRGRPEPAPLQEQLAAEHRPVQRQLGEHPLCHRRPRQPRLARSRILVSSHTDPSSTSRPASSCRTRSAASPVHPQRSSHGSSGCRLAKSSTRSTVEPRSGQVGAPLPLGVGPNVGRVAQPLGLLDLLVGVEGVLDHDQTAGDAGHLTHRRGNVVEVVGGDSAGDDVEARVLERKRLGGTDDIGLHPGRGIRGGDKAAGLGQAAADVAAPGGDVERHDPGRGLTPLDEGVQVGARPVGRARAVRLGPRVPAHPPATYERLPGRTGRPRRSRPPARLRAVRRP